MNTNNLIIKNRGNGKSIKYNNYSQKNIISADTVDQNKPQPKDLSLFKMAKTFNVKINGRQRVKWFFYISNNFDVDLLRKIIEKICSRYGYVGKREIALVKDGWRNQLVIETPNFLFTLENIVQFSNGLLEFAKMNAMFYERWEVVPTKITLLGKIKKWFM